MSTLYESYQASELLRPVLFDPCEEWAGIVKAEVNFGVRFEVLDEGEIRCLVGLFEDMLEIAAGLVCVNEQGEMEFLGHGASFFSLPSYPAKQIYERYGGGGYPNR